MRSKVKGTRGRQVKDLKEMKEVRGREVKELEKRNEWGIR